MKRILILSANPKNTRRLRLDEEMREIKEGLRRAKQRKQFIIETAEAVRYRDIRRAILDFEPNIVHFSGHGEGEEGLVFENETGKTELVQAETLARLFELFAQQVECVVLNACYSQVQASAISQHIPYVIGMKKAIGDRAAIEFAVGFYDGLGAGGSLEFAYKLGCNAIEGANIPEHLTPLLMQSSLPTRSPSVKLPTLPNSQKIIILVGISIGIVALFLWRIAAIFSPAQFSLNNQEIKGTLTEGDRYEEIPIPLRQSQNYTQIRYFDEYFFQGAQGDKILIEMTSQDFDPYLELYAPKYGQIIASNDDISLQDHNAKIEASLLKMGNYRLVVSSSQPGEQGTYSLRGMMLK